MDRKKLPTAHEKNETLDISEQLCRRNHRSKMSSDLPVFAPKFLFPLCVKHKKIQQFFEKYFFIKILFLLFNAYICQTFKLCESVFKHKMAQLPSFDIKTFGSPSEFSGNNLPTKADVLRFFAFLSEREKSSNKKFAYKNFTAEVASRLQDVYKKFQIQTICKKSIFNKLQLLLEKYKSEDKYKSVKTRLNRFLDSLKEVFYIGTCKCSLQKEICSCGIIPENLKEFMFDQFNRRNLTLSPFTQQTTQQETTQSQIDERDDSTYVPSFDSNSGLSDVNSKTHGLSYNKRYRTPNFAKTCDRFGISDRKAACLASALLRDLNFRDKNGNFLIIDKSKVARERQKIREEAGRQMLNTSHIKVFSFDGRKNESLTPMRKNDKLYTSIVKEPHLVVLKEPGTQLIGYVKLEGEDAEKKHIQLNEFFQSKSLYLEQLIGICCDGEPANTGVDNGVLRRFEKHLGRPLHWFVCLLHFNELPLRHLYAHLEKSVTTGPRSAHGKLSKEIESCEKVQVRIAIGNAVMQSRSHFEPYIFRL